MPWEELEELLQPFYGKQERTVVRRPYPLGMLLRIDFLQWYSLSDERMEEEWIDVAVVSAFAGIDLPEGSVADERTIQSFRHLLEEKLSEKILKEVNQCLEDHGLLMRKGTVVDATISDEGRWEQGCGVSYCHETGTTAQTVRQPRGSITAMV